MFPPVNKLGDQLNKIEIKHRRAYPSAEASMISLVEFPPSESAENCLGTNSEGVIRSSSYFVKMWIWWRELWPRLHRSSKLRDQATLLNNSKEWSKEDLLYDKPGTSQTSFSKVVRSSKSSKKQSNSEVYSGPNLNAILGRWSQRLSLMSTRPRKSRFIGSYNIFLPSHPT